MRSFSEIVKMNIVWNCSRIILRLKKTNEVEKLIYNQTKNESETIIRNWKRIRKANLRTDRSTQQIWIIIHHRWLIGFSRSNLELRTRTTKKYVLLLSAVLRLNWRVLSIILNLSAISRTNRIVMHEDHFLLLLLFLSYGCENFSEYATTKPMQMINMKRGRGRLRKKSSIGFH